LTSNQQISDMLTTLTCSYFLRYNLREHLRFKEGATVQKEACQKPGAFSRGPNSNETSSCHNTLKRIPYIE